MPVPTSNFSVSVYDSPQQFPRLVWDTLKAHPRAANVILPHAEEALSTKLEGECWIICSSFESPSESIDFVLSCTEGPMGSYPIFIMSTRPSSQLDEKYLLPRLSLLVRALHSTVSISRVYSLFAPHPVAAMFTDLWVDHTGVPFVPDPYYAATFTFCTKDTFNDQAITILPSLKYDTRPAIESDIQDIADLCYGFASVSEPFVLTREESFREATLLVRNNQVWVHQIQRGDETPELASIVCMTRQSAAVAAITKVYTNPKWRKLGCAERLVRRVCKYLLKTKESVVLYVAHNNNAAKVYHRVGFVGLDEKDCSVEGVEPWLEVGFDRNFVKLGHW